MAANREDRGNQGQQGQSQRAGNPARNLSDEDRRRGGEQSAASQERDEQGQFAGQQGQGRQGGGQQQGGQQGGQGRQGQGGDQEEMRGGSQNRSGEPMQGEREDADIDETDSGRDRSSGQGGRQNR